jgi:hypothetical protein
MSEQEPIAGQPHTAGSPDDLPITPETPEKAAIREELIAAHPDLADQVDGQRLIVSREEYDYRIEQMVERRLIDQAEDVARTADEQARREVRILIRKGLPILEANLTALRGTGTVSAAEQRRMVGDVTKAAIEIIQGLISLNLLEEDEEAPTP